MRSHHERKIWNLAVLLVATTCAGPALGQTHWIRCADTTVLGASGYPGPKRKYTLKGYCKVYAKKTSVEKGINFKVGPHLPFEPYIDPKYGWKVVGEFFGYAQASWIGNTGQTKEGILVEGKKLYTQTNCIKDDPFIKETFCANAVANGDVDMRVLTAIIQSKRPVFAGTVTEGEASTLSQLAGKGGSPPAPPPPPKPAVTVPVAKIGSGGPAKVVGQAPPIPGAGRKPPGGGSSTAKASGGALLVISPTPPPTRPVGRRLRLPPTVTSTPARRRTSG